MQTILFFPTVYLVLLPRAIGKLIDCLIDMEGACLFLAFGFAATASLRRLQCRKGWINGWKLAKELFLSSQLLYSFPSSSDFSVAWWWWSKSF